MAAIQQMLIATTPAATQTGIGGTWDPTNKGASQTLSNGNLTTSVASSNPITAVAVGTGTSNLSSTVVWEVTVVSGITTVLGICNGLFTGGTTHWGFGVGDTEYAQNDGSRYDFAGGNAAFGASYQTAGAIIGFKLTTTTLFIYKNGSLQGSFAVAAGTWKALVATTGSGTNSVTANFGGSAFTYTY